MQMSSYSQNLKQNEENYVVLWKPPSLLMGGNISPKASIQQHGP